MGSLGRKRGGRRQVRYFVTEIVKFGMKLHIDLALLQLQLQIFCSISAKAVVEKGIVMSKSLIVAVWRTRTGRGRPQTSKYLAAIRICLDNGIHPDDIAKYVTDGFETDVKAMELQRARDCAKRISKLMEGPGAR